MHEPRPRNIPAEERTEAELLIGQQGFALYCAGYGYALQRCTTIEAFAEAQRRPVSIVAMAKANASLLPINVALRTTLVDRGLIGVELTDDTMRDRHKRLDEYYQRGRAFERRLVHRGVDPSDTAAVAREHERWQREAS